MTLQECKYIVLDGCGLPIWGSNEKIPAQMMAAMLLTPSLGWSKSWRESLKVLSFFRWSLVPLICVMGAPPVYATGVGVTSAVISTVHIEGGETFITFATPIGNPDGCAANMAIALPTASPNYQGQLALIMTALGTGKHINIWVSGCSWAPWAASVPKLYAVNVQA